jgi:hypothetical protein
MSRPASRLLLAAALLAAVTLLVSCKGGAKAEGAPAYAAYQPAGFDKLGAYLLEVPPVDPAADRSKPPAFDQAKIPADIWALGGKDVRVTGFMLPVKLVNGLVTEFLLVKDQASCCYGGSPYPNHWVMVRLPKGVKNISDSPVHVYGKLTVGPVYDTANYLIAVYSMDAQLAVAAPDAPVDNGQ